jgi:hypothetical protein
MLALVAAPEEEEERVVIAASHEMLDAHLLVQFDKSAVDQCITLTELTESNLPISKLAS